MFKKILALLLATMMVLGGMVTVSAAEETPAAEEEVVYDYTAAAEDLAALGIFKGKVDGNTIDFALEDGVTRLQMALFIARIMTGETNDSYWSKVNDNTTPYDDVVNYFGAVSFADENGIILGKGWIPGVGDNCFDPNGAITYQDAITMAVRALGYKQLQYPNGFLTVGENLGLTADLEPLAGDAELNRGQMIQILKNMLYVKVEGAASFAEQNFGFETKTFVIVATEFQNLLGAEKVTRVDYIGKDLHKQTKYVALAPLNADGTYDMENIVHFTEEELGLEQGESEKKLGYSYTLSTHNGYSDEPIVEPTKTETFTNYGDLSAEIAGGTKYTSIKDPIVKVGDITYRLVESYSNLNNKSTYANRQGELIVHSMFAGDKLAANARYIYDTAGNILDPESPIKDSNGTVTGLNVGLYNYFGTYYVKETVEIGTYVQETMRVATDADFEKMAFADTTIPQYGVVPSLSPLAFSEITLIDDNNDGTYDRGIYIPYSVGKYTTDKQNKDGYEVLSVSAANAKKNRTYSLVNGQPVNAWYYTTGGSWTSYTRVQQDDILFDDSYGYGRPTVNDYVVYYYNPYSRVFSVVENLGTPDVGTVTNMTQGTYKWNSGTSTYIYDGATATIDGTTYKLGYRWNATNKQFGSDLQTIDPNLSSYGFSDVIYANLVGNAYKQMKYLVLADRVILAGDAGNDCGWLAFDYGTYTKNTGGSLVATSYTYNGDIVGVDADGNILVKAYADKSGEQQIVKIGSINGFSYGLLVEDYAALQFQFSGIGSLGTNAMETMKKAVIADFFKTLTADVDDSKEENGEERQYMFIVTGVSADGVYEIYTDHELYWGSKGLYYRQPEYLKQTEDITFVNGVSTTPVWANDESEGDTVLVTDKDTVLVVIGKNGMKTYTGALNGTIDFNYEAKTDTAAEVRPVYAYSISNDFILVASASVNYEDIWDGKWDSAVTTTGYNYYLVLGQKKAENFSSETSVTAAYDAATREVIYTYKNLYNITTGNLETVKVPGGLDEYNSTMALYDAYGYSTPKPIGAIYAEKNGEWTMLTDKDELETLDLAGTAQDAQFATDCRTILNKLLITGLDIDNDGKVEYAPVYSAGAELEGKSINNHILNIESDIYDPDVNFVYDLITYSNKSYVLLKNNIGASSSDNQPGAIYFDYVPGESFVGTAVQGATKLEAPVDPNAPTLDYAMEKAIENLKNLADGKVDTEAYEQVIKAALTIAEVNALEDKFLDEIQDKLDEQTSTANSWADYKTKFTALQSNEYYNDATVKVGAATLKDHVDAWVLAATNNGAYKGSTLTLDDANTNYKAALDAITAAEAKVPTAKIAGKVIVTDNVNRAQALWIFKAEAGKGYNEVGSYNLTSDTGYGVLAGAKIDDVFNAETGEMTYTITFVDGRGNAIADAADVFVAGAEYAVDLKDSNGKVSSFEDLTIAG